MNATSIGIQNGKFVSFDMNEKVYQPLQNQEQIKNDLKVEIQRILQIQLEPLTAKEIIYRCLAKVLDCVIDVYFKTTSIRESNDPLYTELEKFVCSLKSYQNLISGTRTLRINKDNFSILDINGTVLESTYSDLDVIKTLIDDYIKSNPKQVNQNIILKAVLSQYFYVDRVTYICEDNENVIALRKYISESEYYKNNLIKNSKICFKNGKIKIKCRDEYYDPMPSVNEDTLKEEIFHYIENNHSQHNLKKIIFSSLENLSGFTANPKVSKYETIYVGPNNMRREVLKEDPLYVELVSFVESLPKYQENLRRKKENTKKQDEIIKKERVVQKERDFVDRFTFEYHETRYKSARRSIKISI